MEKAKQIKEESKLLSAVMDWLEFEENLSITPAFGDLTQAKSRQLKPSMQRIRTGRIARDASIENCVENLNLSPSDNLMTITGGNTVLKPLQKLPSFLGELLSFKPRGKLP